MNTLSCLEITSMITAIITDIIFILGIIITFLLFFLKKIYIKKMKNFYSNLEYNMGSNIYNVHENQEKFENYKNFWNQKIDEISKKENNILNFNVNNLLIINKEFRNIKKIEKAMKKIQNNFFDNYKTGKEFIEKSNLLKFINIDINKFNDDKNKIIYNISENKITNLTWIITYEIELENSILLNISIENLCKEKLVIEKINIKKTSITININKNILRKAIQKNVIKENLEASLKEKNNIKINII